MECAVLTTREAADYLGLKTVTLARWRCYSAAGKPQWINYGRAIRYLRKDLDEWLESNKRGVSL